MSNITNLKPERVFYYFDKISQIPRGSGNIKAISDYLVNFAKEHSLDYVQEKIGNVIIYKNAAEGYEKSAAVILQGHMDMVCEKNADSNHNFIKDRINLIVDGDYIRADNTTLGADDGIALAYALAVLEADNIAHPAIEAVFTVDEEVGMDGAFALDASVLKGKNILNIDSEEEGILWSSCAGGLRCCAEILLDYENVSKDITAFKISVTGLKGGHSGADIDKGRVNANCLLGQILSLLQKNVNYYISNISGGMKDNAIPREASAEIVIESSNDEIFIKCCDDIKQTIKSEHKTREPQLNINVTKCGDPNKVFNIDTTKRCVLLLNALPNGVVNMSADIDNLVETSLNIGVMKTDEKCFSLDISLRSSVADAKELLKEKVIYITESVGGKCRALVYNPGGVLG